MRILVTGGAGFIGAHLVNRLCSTHVGDIIVLDNLHRGYSRHSLPSSVEFLMADVRDQNAVSNAVRGCDIVFHLAAQSNVMGAVADSSYAFTTNVMGTHVVLEAAAIAGVKRLVFTSSREIYGDPRSIPVRETAQLRPKKLIWREQARRGSLLRYRHQTGA